MPTSPVSSAASVADAGIAAVPTTRFGSHGMVLFGKENIFLSHIPMANAPHDVQLLLEVTVTATSVALPAFDQKLFTFVPSPLSLDARRLGRVHDLNGSVYLGNFEDGGRRIASDVRMHVTRVAFQEVLDDHAPLLEHPTYLVLGTKTDAYVVHQIGANVSASIDHIARLLAVSPEIEAELDGPTPPRLVLSGVDDQSPALPRAAGATLSCLQSPDYAFPCD